MASRLHTTMAAMVADDTPLDAEHQAVVAAWAQHHRETATLVALCARGDLDAAVDTALREVNTAAVRAAWLARPGRDRAELVSALAGERRVAVLSALAATPGLPDAVYAEIVTRCGGCAPLVEIACGGNVGEDTAAAAMETLSQSDKRLTADQSNRVHTALRASVALRHVVFTHGTRDDLLVAALGSADDAELDEVATGRLVEILVLAPLRSVVRRSANCETVGNRDRYEAVQVAGLAIRLFGTAAELTAQRREALDLFNTLVGFRWAQRRPVEVQDAVAELIADAYVGGTPLVELRSRLTGGGPAEVTATVATLVASKNRTLAERNRASTLLREAIRSGVIGPPDMGAVLRAFPSLCADALETQPVTAEVAVLVAQHCPSLKLTCEAITGCVDPHAAFAEFCASDETPPHRLLWYLTHAGIDDASYALLPATVLIFQPGSRAETAVVSGAGRWMLDRVGADPQRWALFEQLHDGFSGTLGELVAVIDTAT